MPEGAENPFPIVGVGASAGGLSAVTQLLSALPPRPGLALVVVQHLDPKHESRLSELLKPGTSMTVVDARHGVRVDPDHVYVIQPNTSVAIADGVSQGSSLILVALSGVGQQEDKARAAEAGFDRHFTKPVDVNALRAFLASAGRE